MTYQQFLLTAIFRHYCTEYANMEYDIQFEVAFKLWEIFEESEYNDPSRDLHTCIVLWIDSIDWRHNIQCDCGNWEEFPATMPRHASQAFDYVKNSELDATAYYKCDCGVTNRSEIIPDFDYHFPKTD